MDYELPTEFDLIVIGTGIIESIVSAAASRIGKRVLHLDSNNYYGGLWASFNLEDLINIDYSKNSIENFTNNWNIQSETKDTDIESETAGLNVDKLDISNNDNTKQDDLNVLSKEFILKNSRKFVIDLTPKLQYARGEMVELLISSNIARYAEFRNVSRVLTYLNGSLEIVPCSRSDVFANNKVSVIEKRMLMKLLTSIENEAEVGNDVVLTFKEYLEQKKLSKNLVHYVLYALSMSTDKTSGSKGIKNTKRFLKSLGRFGKTPFLFSMYGSGELTQAFCRLSAVFGGIFALNQNIPSVKTDDDQVFTSILCGKQNISAKNLVTDVRTASTFGLVKAESEYISRAVFITNRSVMKSEQEHLTLLLYPDNKGEKLCIVLELGYLTGTCPKGLFLVHITCKGSGDPKKDIEECASTLFDFENQQSEKPFVCWSCYFSIPNSNDLDLDESLSKNIFVCPGPDMDLDYDQSVHKAKLIFNQLYPNEEFLPRAPDADEIVVEEDAELASEPTEVNSEKNVESSSIIEEKIDECMEAKEL